MRSTIIAVTTLAFVGCATTQSGSLSPSQRFATRLRELPTFQARASGKDSRESAQLMNELAARGLPKLSDKQLLALIRLNAKMLSKADEAPCGSFARGVSTPSEREVLLKTLSERDQEAYHELRYLAATAELADPPVAGRGPGTEAEVRAAMSTIEMPLPPGDRPVFESNLGGIAQLENPAACKTMRTLYELILQAEGPAQATVVRAVLTR